MTRRLLADFSPIDCALVWLTFGLLALSLANSVPLRAQDAPAELAMPLDRRLLAPTLGTLPYPQPVTPLPTPPQPRPPWRGPVPPGPTHLTQMVRAAGIIFSGHVTHVGRAGPASGQAPAATTITFQVEHAMRGTVSGQSVTIREWAGLWSRGDRYRVGENVLLFLYPPSKLGLTSPVSGAMGRFAMDPRGRIILSAEHVNGFAGHPILGGKTSVAYTDFARAVRSASPGEWIK